MAQFIRFDNTDQHITYSDEWKIIPNSGVGQNAPYSLTSTINAQLFFLFRGSSVRLYGRLGGGGGQLGFRLHSNETIVSLNGTNFDDGPILVWSAYNLGDGDNQLLLYVKSLQQNGSVVIDYFEVENPSGNAFDLLSAGPNATNVPKEAIFVDNTGPDILFSNLTTWNSINGSVQHYRRSLSYTTQPGASLSFSFDGVAIWYYSFVARFNGFYTVSIDGSEPERLDGKQDNNGEMSQQMLWSKTDLTPGSHIFTLKKDNVSDTWMCLDFFRVLRVEDASALPSSTPTTTPGSKSNTVPLAVGLTLGLLLPALAVLSIFYLRRRSRNATLPRKGDQLSGTPHESKHGPQPIQPPTHGSTLSSSAPMAAAVPTTPIGIPG